MKNIKTFVQIIVFYIVLMLLPTNIYAVKDKKKTVPKSSKNFEIPISQEATYLDSNALVQVREIHVIVDGVRYINPNKNTETEKKIPKFAIIFSEVTARKGSQYSTWYLNHKIKFWLFRLQNTGYYKDIKIKFSVVEDDASDDTYDTTVIYKSEHKPILLTIELSSRFTTQVWADNYDLIGSIENTMLGASRSFNNGLTLMGNLGVYRQDVTLLSKNLLFQHKEKEYVRLPLSFQFSGIHNWNDIQYDPTASSILGFRTHVGLRVLSSIEVKLGGGLFIASTWDTTISRYALQFIGLPALESNKLSYFGETGVSFYMPFKELDFYSSFISVDIPIIIGKWNYQSENYQDFDTYGFITKFLYGFRLGIDQAIKINAAIIGNGVFKTQPYFAKANLHSSSFDNYLLTYQIYRRGNLHPYDTYIGSKGYAINLEYSAIMFKFIGAGAIELGLYYDMGATAETLDDFQKNTRHNIGPLINIYWHEPINLQAGISLNFGGNLLYDQPDGQQLNLSFYIKPLILNY